MRTLSRFMVLSAATLAMLVPPALEAQSFDTSGTSSLSGPYLFRYVNFFNDAAGNLTESCMLTGVMTFDGQGHYTTSGTQLYDSDGSNTGYCANLGGGTYGVQSNGIAQLDNPMYPATLFGAFSQPVVIASATEDFYFDLFIAIQAPAAAASNGSLTGAFTVGTLDYFNASITTARQGYFTLNADGQGNIGAFTFNGSEADINSGASLTQSVPASTYALSGTAGGTWTIPSGSGTQPQIVDGSKVLYVSADGNWVLGGSAAGSDMMFGFRAPSGTVTNSYVSGTYFLAGMQSDPNVLIAGYWGSINTNGDGTLIRHERFDYVASEEAYDYTTYESITIGADGTYYDGNIYTYLVGANGNAMMEIGSGSTFALGIGIRAPYVTPTSTVWIDPIGVTDSANYTPITNAYTPGEMVSLYGTFGVPYDVGQKLPIQTSLDGVQVFVNGIEAPVMLVSPNQVVTLIPWEIAGQSFATFQVAVNESKSNEVTVYVDYSAPGIFTLAESGIGPSAILHADYTLVDENSPAQPGEAVLLFMEGLGSVTPTVLDGAAGPSQTLSDANEYDDDEIEVFLDDGVDQPASADLYFAGLAPGFAGLYQVNFAVPEDGLTNGDVYILLYTNEAISEMSTIAVTGFTQSAARPVSARRVFGPRVHPKRARSRRRALPERAVK